MTASVATATHSTLMLIYERCNGFGEAQNRFYARKLAVLHLLCYCVRYFSWCRLTWVLTVVLSSLVRIGLILDRW